MCEQRSWIVSLQESLRPQNYLGINNIGLMARALALQDNASPGEDRNVKWQTLQVSTLSIASCIGRILIGISPSGAPLISLQLSTKQV